MKTVFVDEIEKYLDDTLPKRAAEYDPKHATARKPRCMLCDSTKNIASGFCRACSKKRAAEYAERWHRVYATQNLPGSVRRVLAQFRTRLDADVWADGVRQTNPTWTVEVQS